MVNGNPNRPQGNENQENGAQGPDVSGDNINQGRRSFMKDAMSALVVGVGLTSPVAAAVSKILAVEDGAVDPESQAAQASQSVGSLTPPTIQEIDGEEVAFYEETRGVMLLEKFRSKEDTSGRYQHLVHLFKITFNSDKREFIYYDLWGRPLARAAIPKGFSGWSDKKKTEWHNENRKECAGMTDKIVTPTDPERSGFPFVTTSSTIAKSAASRLEQTSYDVNYFDGKEITIKEAIRKITAHYGVPYHLALGLGGIESAFKKDAVSSADAVGIFQFLDSTARGQAIPYVDSAEDTDFRSAPIYTDFAANKYNRFYQTELFCAHYNYLKQKLKPQLGGLTARIRQIDPNFNTDLEEVAIMTCHNAGLNNPDHPEQGVIPAIARFMTLSDKEIKARLGRPPYGLDVWLALLANSYGYPESTIGPNVFHYAIKAYAMGSLLSGTDMLEKYKEPRSDQPVSERASQLVSSGWKTSRRVSSGMAGAVAVATSLASVPLLLSASADLGKRQVTRRTFGKVVAGAFATASMQWKTGFPFRFQQNKAEKKAEEAKQEQLSQTTTYEHEVYPDVLEKAKEELDKVYVDLKKQGAITLRTSETSRCTGAPVQMTAQKKLLADTFDEALGEDFSPTKIAKAFESRKYFIQSKAKCTNATCERENDKEIAAWDKKIEELSRSYKAWRKKQMDDGEIIKMEADNKDLPYFCQQVGPDSGEVNYPESLWMHKEFEPILGTLVELVNYQIDLFNADPAAYGHPELAAINFKIPRISALKISGAMRNFAQQYDSYNPNKTKDKSAHLIGRAIDITAPRKPVRKEWKVARLVDPFVFDDEVLMPAGAKLHSKKGEGDKTRIILSAMIGRALVYMQEPLKKEVGVEILPLWENSSQCYHITMKPPQSGVPNSKKEEIKGPVSVQQSNPEPAPQAPPSIPSLQDIVEEAGD
jgi:hypothetical protein